MMRSIVVLALVTVLLGTCPALGTDVTWDGGPGEWNSVPGMWNGGQTSVDVLGGFRGWEHNDGVADADIVIDGPTSAVTFDPNSFGDFNILAQGEGNGGSLTISGGASLSIDSNTGDEDGYWTQFNAETLTLDNGTLRRTFSGGTTDGAGVFSFGGIRGHANMDIAIELINGGRIENIGAPLTFGWYTENYVGRRVTMTINDGHLELDGGTRDYLSGQAGGAGNGALQFHMGWDETAGAPIGEEYAVNFTGPGSITVDDNGIIVPVQIGPTEADFDFDTVTTLLTYEELWEMGILQANGLSGQDGETFGDFFTTTGDAGMNDYVLTSLVGTGGVAGDYNGDESVNAADYTAYRDRLGSDVALDNDDGLAAPVRQEHYDLWKANFGNSTGNSLSAGSAVPEPGCGALMLAIVLGMFLRGRRI